MPIFLLLFLLNIYHANSQNISSFDNIKAKLSSVTYLNLWGVELYKMSPLEQFSTYDYPKQSFPVIYCGAIKDTFWLPESNIEDAQLVSQPVEKNIPTYTNGRKTNYPTEENFTIWVDTTKTIPGWSRGGVSGYPSEPEQGFYLFQYTTLSEDSSILYVEEEAYPVWLISNAADTLTIGNIKTKLNLELQIKNKEGDWLPVYKYIPSSCGMRLLDSHSPHKFTLPPKQVALTTCPIYQGKGYQWEVRTSMRLVCGYNKHICSNEFYGWVYKDLFEEKLKNDGE